MESYLENNWTWIVFVLIWSILWKGWALWRAANNNDKVWFILLLVINTIGILEIFYIFYFSKKNRKDDTKPIQIPK